MWFVNVTQSSHTRQKVNVFSLQHAFTNSSAHKYLVYWAKIIFVNLFLLLFMGHSALVYIIYKFLWFFLFIKFQPIRSACDDCDFYHQSKTPISFLCRWKLNFWPFIQLSETLLVELIIWSHWFPRFILNSDN